MKPTTAANGNATTPTRVTYVLSFTEQPDTKHRFELQTKSLPWPREHDYLPPTTADFTIHRLHSDQVSSPPMDLEMATTTTPTRISRLSSRL